MAGGSEAQPPEELNRSFDGFEDEEEGGGDIGEMVSEGGRRRVFSKVLDKRNTEVYCFNFSRSLAKCGEHTVGRFYNGIWLFAVSKKTLIFYHTWSRFADHSLSLSLFFLKY